jgi:hypothetical protein
MAAAEKRRERERERERKGREYYCRSTYCAVPAPLSSFTARAFWWGACHRAHLKWERTLEWASGDRLSAAHSPIAAAVSVNGREGRVEEGRARGIDPWTLSQPERNLYLSIQQRFVTTRQFSLAL